MKLRGNFILWGIEKWGPSLGKTASEEDIDLAMKLGTNYPYGPFEWARKIGIKHIYEILEALYEDTKDERYKISPLLKKEFLLKVS